MLEILQSLQDDYVPIIDSDKGQKHVVHPIFLGGDNLTEERARNLQGAMADGDSDYETLNGISPKNEDWHAIRYMYKVTLILLLASMWVNKTNAPRDISNWFLT